MDLWWDTSSRIQRAKEARDDAAWELKQWSFSMKPSEREKLQRKVDRLDAKVQRLRDKRSR